MKKLSSVFGLLALAATFAAGCVDEDPNYNKGDKPTDQTIGYLASDNLDLNVIMDTDQNSDRNTSSTRAENPTFVAGSEAATTDDYWIEILPVEGGEAPYAGLFKDLKTRISDEQASNGKGMALPVGTYTVKAWSNQHTDRTPELMQSTPSYMGSTPADKPLRIVKGAVAEPVKVTCRLVNIKVTVEIEESLRKNHAGESILDIEEAWVNLGETKFIYRDNDGWDKFGVSAGEDGGMEFDGPTKPVYFRAVNTENMLQFHFKATPQGGSTVTLNKNIPAVKGGHWRRIKIVGRHDTQGNLTFDVEVSTLVQDETIHAGDDAADPATSTWAEDTMTDPDDVAGAPKVEWQGGDVNADIAVGASNPSANTLTIRTANRIASIALAATTTNSDFAADFESLNVPNLCTTPESTRMLTRYGIPFGSELVGKEELSFSLDKIMNEIRTFNGRYVFTLEIADQKGFTTTQALTFVVGDAPAAVAPTIVWVGYDIDQVQTATRDMTIKIDITAAEHFEKIAVNIISERLTPQELADVGLPSKFDLCNVQSFTKPTGETVSAEELSATLKELLQLNVINGDLKALSSTSFDVSQFVGMLGGIAAGTLCTFELTVEGSNGESLTKSIKLDIPENF